ncbi:MAG: metallophosphoesterase [Elainella sp.]
MHKLLSGELSVEQITVEITGLPKALQGTKIAQLSDLHFDGLRLSNEMLAEAIAICNQARPDLVALTGDLVTDDPAPIQELAGQLQQLSSRCGTYAVLGNHDIYPAGSREQITQALEQVGIQVLWNQITYPFGPDLPVVGLADFWSKQFQPATVMAQLDPDKPRLVLSHNPDTAAPLSQWRIDLQLSGHTHGGQIALPGIGPIPTWYQMFRSYIPKALRPWIPYMREDCYRVVRHWEWAQGFHQIPMQTAAAQSPTEPSSGQRPAYNQLYVNRGLGTYLPGRLFCPPEVTLITLVASVAS